MENLKACSYTTHWENSPHCSKLITNAENWRELCFCVCAFLKMKNTTSSCPLFAVETFWVTSPICATSHPICENGTGWSLTLQYPQVLWDSTLTWGDWFLVAFFFFFLNVSWFSHFTEHSFLFSISTILNSQSLILLLVVEQTSYEYWQIISF